MPIFYGGAEDDNLIGTNDEDILNGFQGDDSLFGGDGDDVLVDGPGVDHLFGGGGDDYLINVSGNGDVFDGGPGFDILYDDLRGFDLSTVPGITMDMRADIHRVTDGNNIDSAPRIEGFVMLGLTPIIGIGDNGKNLFVTDRGSDRLVGNGGADTLDSGRGADRLIGGRGHDQLDGGKGRDVSSGGLGRDTFLFERGDGFDTITDFKAHADTLALDVAFYEIGESITDFLDRYATDLGNRVRLDFGDGDRLVLNGVRTIAELQDAIDLI